MPLPLSTSTTVLAPDGTSGAQGLLTLVLSTGGRPDGRRFLVSCAHVLRPPGDPSPGLVRDGAGEALARGILAADLAAPPSPADAGSDDVGIAELLRDVDPRVAQCPTTAPVEGWDFVPGDAVTVVLPREPAHSPRAILAVGESVEFRVVARDGREIRYTLTDQVLVDGAGLAPGDSGATVVGDLAGLLQPIGMFVGFDIQGRGVVTRIGPVLAAARALAAGLDLQPLLDLTPMRIERRLPPVMDAPVAPGQPLFRLTQAGGEEPFLSGPAMLALQVALGAWGIAVAADGVAGGNTRRAWQEWQARQGHPPGTEVGVEAWRQLLGGPGGGAAPPPSAFDLCIGVISAFEGTRLDRAVGNFDGAGITFGLIGFNVKWGSLGRLVAGIDRLNPGLIDVCFGPLAEPLRHILAGDGPEERVHRAGVALDENGHLLDDWRDAFWRLGGHREAREAQLQAARAYWDDAKAFWNDVAPGEPASLLDMGLCLDIAAQNGRPKGAELSAHRAAAAGQQGAGRRDKLAQACADHSAARWRADVLARKSCFVNGGGTVHGGRYELSEWGLSGRPLPPMAWDAPTTLVELLEARLGPAPLPVEDSAPATEEAAGQGPPADPAIGNWNSPHRGWAHYRDFLAFFAGLGLTDFIADEVLVMGGGHAAGPCAGLNDYPPPDLWGNIAPTLAVLQRLRTELGAAIRVTSAYRAPAYNACLGTQGDGVAANSQHMQFRALDFQASGVAPSEVAARLEEMRRSGAFTGWFKAYPTFTHLDTRGA